MSGDWCSVETRAYPSSVTGMVLPRWRGTVIRTQPGRLRPGREPSVSLRVSLFPTVWDRILGHPTDIFAQVADPAFNLSRNRSLGRLLRGGGTAPELAAA
jgi:hypothetical protein